MRQLSEKIFKPLRLFAAVVAVAVVAVAAGAAVAPQRAWAEITPDAEGKWLGYYAEPLKEDGKAIEYPGFEWVDPTDTEPGYYSIYIPYGANEPLSHDTVCGWWYFADIAREHTFDGYLIRLDEDLDFSEVNWDRVSQDRLSFTVGSDDVKFSGTFDGQDHTLKNFNNYRDGLDVVPNCGFFGSVNDAVIKNTNFFNCYVGTSYCGGLVAGQAIDTLFMNLSCENCTLSIVPGNNVINLITNAGLSGGMIVGDANGSTLYDCEMVAGRVVTNATAGLAALGGQPLYLGALVGGANDTTIEYCRVRDGFKLDEDGNKTGEREFASVRNRYDTGASVASYTELFTGGIVGAMQGEDTGSKIVDCYSTADVESYAAIRFAVGLGLGVTRGYTGGIAGIVRDAGNGENLIQRVSYAGNLHSYNYNVILLGIPAIEYDKYMGGITGRGGDNATIDQAYFKRYGDNGFGSSTEEDIYAVKTTYGGGYMDGTSYGARDSQYTDREGFWETKGFDFAGGTLRNVGYTFTKQTDPDWVSNHYNKWVMDYGRGIPVHGGSIKATMDFPGSGEVSIGETSYSPETVEGQTTTDNPYDFAVQGFMSGDDKIDITYTLNNSDRNDSWAADSQNQGFKFLGWHYNRDVRVNDIPENHSLFTTPNSTLNTSESGILDDKYKLGKTDSTITVTEPVDLIDVKPGEYEDNDLYVAHAQAMVLLHDVDGNVINKNGTADNAEDLEDDWYDYEDTITLPVLVAADTDVAGTFVGWTTEANVDGDVDKGYASISSSDLAGLKENGHFWEPGAIYTVTAPANLYPVYSQYENIYVIYEGHDSKNADGSDDLTKRNGYGSVQKDPTSGNLVLSVIPESDSPLVAGTVHFLGWYEYVGDATTPEDADKDAEATHWLRVSRGTQEGEVAANTPCYAYDLTKAGVDLTGTHIYKARFEYEVVYYHPSDPDEGSWEEYATVWHLYNQEFDNIDGPDAGEREFLHWAKGEPPATGGLIGCKDNDSFAGTKIIEPTHVLAHVNTESTAGREIYAVSDFPTGPKVSTEFYGITKGSISFVIDSSDFYDATSNPDGGFSFYGWTADKDDGILEFKESHKSSSWEEGLLTNFAANHTYWYEAHVTARVTFHGVPDGDSYANRTVERRYEQAVFLDSTINSKYTYHFSGDESDLSSTNEAFSFDTDMTRAGLIFLGWIDLSDTDVMPVIDVIASKQDNYYLANSYDAVSAYLMTGDEVCTRPMDLYPVYVAAFDLETSTNIHLAGVDGSVYNIPDDPALVDGRITDSVGNVTVDYNDDGGTVYNGASDQVTLNYNKTAQAEVDITVDLDTDVWIKAPAGSEGEKYTFVSLSVLVDGEEVETIPASSFEGGKLEGYVIEAGRSYEFRANYSPVPVLVTYHMSGDSNDIEVYDREVGDLLPAPQGSPSFSVEDSYFVGWTVDNDGTSYVEWDDNVALANPGADTVTGTMHLWPVYRAGNVTVDSNIDETVSDESHRYTEKRGDALVLVAEDVEGFRFEGWYTGYASEDDPGKLVTAEHEYTLTGDKRFDGTKYTAVYKDMSTVDQVRYHDTEGNVIYTAYADDETANRTFYEKQVVEVPSTDAETGEVTYVEEEQYVLIDTEAFSQIADILLQANSDPDAISYEEFLTWQWVDADDITSGANPQRWGKPEDDSNFVSQKVANNVGNDNVMDLYPVTVKLTATSPGEAEAEPYAGSLSTQLTMSDDGSKLESVAVTLNESYAKPWLKVHLDEVAYDEGQANQSVSSTTDALGQIPVTLKDLTGGTLDTDTTRSGEEEDAETGQTLKAGDAIFSFGGRIQITKRSQDVRAAGQTFTFTVKEKNGGGAATVSVKVGDTATGGWYSGSATIEVPFGEYTVTEDDWAWRYDATVETWASDADIENDGSQPGWVKDGDVTVQYGTRSGNNPDGRTSAVRATNVLTNEKWFDGEDLKHNVFGKGSE